MKKITLLLIISIGLLIGCKKESGPTTKTETPIQATIAAEVVVDTAIVYGFSSYEFGNKFYVSRNGNITKLGCRMPEVGSYRVSLWDFVTQNLITATTVNVTDTSKFTYNNISSVAVTANTRYVISLNNTSSSVAKKYFIFFKKPTPSGATIYPFTSGSVTYEDFREKGSSTSTFPTAVLAQWTILGVPDMQFEYTE